MIDLHCHILPGVDDGVKTIDEALALARELVTAGVRTVAATPHLRDDHPGVRASELASSCEHLAGHLRAADVPLSVIPAAEVDLIRALEANDEERRLASFGQRGTDLLLETPYGPLPTSFEEQVFSSASEAIGCCLHTRSETRASNAIRVVFLSLCGGESSCRSRQIRSCRAPIGHAPGNLPAHL